MKRLFFTILMASNAFVFAQEKKTELKLLSVSLTKTETKIFSKPQEPPRKTGGAVGVCSNISIGEKPPANPYWQITIRMQVNAAPTNREISDIIINPVKTNETTLKFRAYGFGENKIINSSSNLFPHQIKKIDKISGSVNLKAYKCIELRLDNLKDKLGKTVKLPELKEINAKLKFTRNKSGSLNITVDSGISLNMYYFIKNLKSPITQKSFKFKGYTGVPFGKIMTSAPGRIIDKETIFQNNLSSTIREERVDGKTIFSETLPTGIALDAITNETCLEMKIAVPSKKITVPFCFENIELP